MTFWILGLDVNVGVEMRLLWFRRVRGQNLIHKDVNYFGDAPPPSTVWLGYNIVITSYSIYCHYAAGGCDVDLYSDAQLCILHAAFRNQSFRENRLQ